MTAEKKLSIGAIARAAGIPEATLRTWERRYGFPEPIRLPSGHRRYSSSVVPKLKLIAAAKDLGLQPSDSSSMTEEQLREFVSSGAVQQLPAGNHWLQQVHQMDDAAFDAQLERERNRLGVEGYVEHVVGPLLHMIGDAWADGTLSVAEEHWASERIRHSLSSQWTVMSAQNTGPTYLCATLPGEQHDLGLQMAAAVLATHGARVLYLGANTPVEAVLETAEQRSISCVCLSVSSAAPPLQTRGLVSTLRQQLPNRIGLIIGGAGSFQVDGASQLVAWDDLVSDVRRREARSTS